MVKPVGKIKSSKPKHWSLNTITSSSIVKDINAATYYGSSNTKMPPVILKNANKKIPSSAILVKLAGKPESKMTPFEKMELTREGISKKELEQLKINTTLDYEQLAHILGVARATLIAKKGTEKFAPALSEKIMSLADIYSYGNEVFGDKEQFNKWIFQPIAALGGKIPYDLLDNQFGREEIRNLIGRIEYGVYS